LEVEKQKMRELEETHETLKTKLLKTIDEIGEK